MIHDTFWTALKESLLEMIFGYWGLQQMRQDAKRRKELSAMAQRQYEEYRRICPN